MFTNFNSIFKDSKENVFNVPKEILDILNRDIPKGFTYKHRENGICYITTEDGSKMDIKTKIKFPEIPIDIRSRIHNLGDLYEYLYRTQKRCEVIPDEDGKIQINGKKIDINKLVKNVVNDKALRYEIVPNTFPKAEKMEIKAGNITKSFLIERKPYESFDKILLKSVEETPICVKFYISKNDVDFNISISISELENIEEIVDVCEFYKSFLNGDIIINGMKLKNGEYSKSIQNADIDDKITFWNKALAIEKVLNRKFDARKFDINKDYLTVLRLYKSLIENKPYKIDDKIKSIKFEKNEPFNEYKKMIGLKMILEYTREEDDEIFGETINYLTLERIYNCKIISAVEEDTSIRMEFDKYEENNTFIVRKSFLNREELEQELISTNKNNAEYEDAELI